MGVLSDGQIRRLVGAGELVIEPYDEVLLQPATYDLRLGSKILASPLSADISGAVIRLSDNSPSYNIQSGQMISVISAEKLKLPLTICGRFGIRSSFSRLGLDDFGGIQLDPGFRGHLILNLLNVGPEPIRLSLGDALFSVEFQSLDEPAEKGYQGPYQDQDDFPEDQYDFILSARTTSLAEIPALRRDCARLGVLIEELEEKLPDPDEGLVLKPEVEEMLRRSLQTPPESMLSIEEMRKKQTP